MRTLTENLLRSWEENPHRTALRLLEGETATDLDFAALLAGAARYAGALGRAGIQPGEVVVIILEHGRDPRVPRLPRQPLAGLQQGLPGDGGPPGRGGPKRPGARTAVRAPRASSHRAGT